MDIEISVHVSPVDYLLNRVRYLVESFRLFGGSDLRYRFIVTVGADQEPEDLEARCPWATDHPIEFRWAERAIFRDHSWQGVGLDRFRHNYSAPLVLFVDSDLLFAASVREAFERLPSGRAIAGVMEFRSPFIGESGLSSPERWRALYRSAGLGEPSLRFKYSIDRYPGHDICPAHFGLAFVLARREVVAEIGHIIFDELEIVERDAPGFFSDELALTLAIDRLGLAAAELPIRFSHPLSEGLYEFKNDWRRPVVLNYTTNDTFSAKTDIESPDTVAAWLRITEPKAGVREIFRRKMAKVHAAVERSGKPLLSTDPLPPDRVVPDGDDFRVPEPPPRLIGSIGSTNLVEFGGKIFAVPQQQGALDIADERARLASGIIAGDSLDEVFEKLGPTAIVEDGSVEIRTRLKALEESLLERTGRIASLEVAMEERDQRLKGVEATMEERSSRLRAVEKTLEQKGRQIAAIEVAVRERFGRS